MVEAVDCRRIIKEREIEILTKWEGEEFVDWADAFFADDRHFNVPISLNEMLISYLTFLGEKTITDNMVLGSYSLFRRKVKRYCECMQIIVNPDVVFMPSRKPKDWDSWDENKRNEYRKKTTFDKKKGLVRRFMWGHPIQDGRFATEQPRELSVVRGCFFFKSEEDVFVDIWDFDDEYYRECDWEKKVG